MPGTDRISGSKPRSEALLLTLALIFALQSKDLTSRWEAVLLISVPIIVQVSSNSGLTYLLMRWFRMEHNVASPVVLTGASNFFELAVAVAITLFGADSPAALATVVGVLVEVPVMLSVCNLRNRSPGCYGGRLRVDSWIFRAAARAWRDRLYRGTEGLGFRRPGGRLVMARQRLQAFRHQTVGGRLYARALRARAVAVAEENG